MTTFEQFSNDIIVDILETAFYGKNALPILSLDFPRTPGWQTMLEDNDTGDRRGTIDDTVEWEFGIEVLLTGEKYLNYVKELELPATIEVYFSVNSDISVSYEYSPGTYEDPPEEHTEIDSIDNNFNESIWVEGEEAKLNERTVAFFKEFSKKYESDTDEDMEGVATKNWQSQLLAKIIRNR
jgi:hypothetical protein